MHEASDTGDALAPTTAKSVCGQGGKGVRASVGLKDAEWVKSTGFNNKVGADENEETNRLQVQAGRVPNAFDELAHEKPAESERIARNRIVASRPKLSHLSMTYNFSIK